MGGVWQPGWWFPSAGSGQALRRRWDGIGLLGAEDEPGPGMAGAGIDVIASNAIRACVAGSAGNAGRDGEPATPG